MIGERGMDAMAAEQEPVVLPQPDRRVVEAGEFLEADRAVEQMREVAATGDVVLGEPLQPSFAQAVGAGIADVNDIGKAAATGSSTKRRSSYPRVLGRLGPGNRSSC